MGAHVHGEGFGNRTKDGSERAEGPADHPGDQGRGGIGMRRTCRVFVAALAAAMLCAAPAQAARC